VFQKCDALMLVELWYKLSLYIESRFGITELEKGE
jgi:hypothetical protein